MNSKLPKPLFENWENLPSLVHHKCVAFMDRDTRSALKACSRYHKWLVEKLPLKNPVYCRVEIGRKWNSKTEFELRIMFGRTKYRADKEWIYVGSMIDEFNDIVEKKLANCDIFEFVNFCIQDCPGFKFTSPVNSLRSRAVFIRFRDSSQAVECLKQFDPKYLAKLHMFDGKRHKAVYDELLTLKQVTSAKSLELHCLLNENHLMQFKAKRLIVPLCLDVTTNLLNKYIKKRLLDLDQADFHFHLRLERRHSRSQIDAILRDLTVTGRGEFLIVESPSPTFQLKLIVKPEFIEGTRISTVQ